MVLDGGDGDDVYAVRGYYSRKGKQRPSAVDKVSVLDPEYSYF